MQTITAILSLISKAAGAACVAVALLSATGRIFPPTVAADDVAAVSLLAFVEGALYLLPQRVLIKNNRRVLLYIAATLFVPFLVALAAAQYTVQASALTPQVTSNLMSAAAVFLLALCPPASLIVAVWRRDYPAPKD